MQVHGVDIVRNEKRPVALQMPSNKPSTPFFTRSFSTPGNLDNLVALHNDYVRSRKGESGYISKLMHVTSVFVLSLFL